METAFLEEGRIPGIDDLQVVAAADVGHHPQLVAAGDELHAAVLLPRRHQRRPDVEHSQLLHVIVPHAVIGVHEVGVAAVLVPPDASAFPVGELGTHGVVGIEANLAAQDRLDQVEELRMKEIAEDAGQVQFPAEALGRPVHAVPEEPIDPGVEGLFRKGGLNPLPSRINPAASRSTSPSRSSRAPATTCGSTRPRRMTKPSSSSCFLKPGCMESSEGA